MSDCYLPRDLEGEGRKTYVKGRSLIRELGRLKDVLLVFVLLSWSIAHIGEGRAMWEIHTISGRASLLYFDSMFDMIARGQGLWMGHAQTAGEVYHNKVFKTTGTPLL